MKKNGTFLLALLLALSAFFTVSCGKNASGTGDAQPSQTIERSVESEKAETQPGTATDAPEETSDISAEELNELVERFVDEAPCLTHGWVHVQFAAAATLTEESLGEAILYQLGSPSGVCVRFDEGDFEAIHSDYQGEGDGCSAGGIVRFTLENASTGESSETARVFFYIEKNLEREGFEFTVCPDEKDG